MDAKYKGFTVPGKLVSGDQLKYHQRTKYLIYSVIALFNYFMYCFQLW